MIRHAEMPSLWIETQVAAGKRRQPCSGTKELPANLDVFKNHPSHSAVSSGAFDVEARSAVSLGLLDVEGRSADSSVFFCVFVQSSPSVGIFGQRTGRWYFFAVKSLDRNFDQRT